MTTQKPHAIHIVDADGALDALTEGLRLHGITLPSLGIDLASLTESPDRPPLITLGSVPADTARALGKVLLMAYRSETKRDRAASDGSRMTLRIGQARLVDGKVNVLWNGSPCAISVADDAAPEARPAAFPPCRCGAPQCPDRQAGGT